MFVNRFLSIVFWFVISFGFSELANAQNNSSNSNNASLDLNFSNDIGGFYFQDPTGIQIAITGLPYEGTIDKKTYRLGSNDLISIEVDGPQKLVLRSLLINSTGDITLPSLGIISLKDLTISEAEEILVKAFSEDYKSPLVNLSIELPRNINIHISGSIPFPGKYSLPAQSRVDLAILQSLVELKIEETQDQQRQETIYLPAYTSRILTAGDYSLRNIKIEHKDGRVSNADLVDYFRTGNLKNNPVVYDGDQITIERVSENTPSISISGAVRYGYDLEFKSGESISDLLKIAGYFEENADSSKVILLRSSNAKIDQIEVLPTEWDSFSLEPNDRIVVPENPFSKSSSIAIIRGEINLPGHYPIIEGSSTIFDLLNLSGGLTSNALPSAAYLIRGNRLENEIPNKFNTNLMARTSNQYIQGIDYLKQETSLSRNRVYFDLMNEDELRNIILFDGDELFVPRDEKTIFIFGQVNNPGYFPFQSINQASVSDYIQRAGGFALSADKDRVFIIKVGNSSWFKPGETKIESGDRIFVDRYPVEDLNALRTYEIQKAQERNTRIQLIMTGITTITGIITTYVAIESLRGN
ncbi:MAG: SLBB domain-containing protein [Balneolaceae bacterium]